MVRHAGAALDQELGEQARKETETNPRYRWLGPLPFERARELLASSRLMVLSSRDEGGANVVSEAIVDGVPVLSTDISGSRGLLGDDYPGYYPVGDDEGLASLLLRARGRLPRPSPNPSTWRSSRNTACGCGLASHRKESGRPGESFWAAFSTLVSGHRPRSDDQPREGSQRHHAGR